MKSHKPLDYELESATGGRRTLRAHRGQRVAIFYEQREHMHDNFGLKKHFISPTPASPFGRARVVAIANVKALNFHPARTFTEKAVQAISNRFGLEFLLDWDARLLEAPFSFVPGLSNVIVVDEQGIEVYRHVGPMTAADQARFVEALAGSNRAGMQFAHAG